MKHISILVLLCSSWWMKAQVSYTIDSTSLNALSLDGGVVEIQFADVNADGHPDLITTGDHGCPLIGTNQQGINVFFGNGAGSFSLFNTGDFGYGGIAAGDINNDGYMDVAYGVHHDYSLTDFGDQLLEAALGDGTGINWIPWDDGLATNGEDYGMMGTDLGDINEDGLLDIAGNSFGCCAGVHVYRNEGNGSWTQTFGYIGGNTMHYIKYGDMNHDGHLDLAACSQNGSIWFGDGIGNFSASQTGLPPLGNLGYYDISLDDIDRDGDDDLAGSANGNPFVARWDNDQQTWNLISDGLPGGTFVCSRLADLDKDGYSEIIIVQGEVMSIFSRTGTTWSQLLSFPLPNLIDCEDMAIDDYDHNGYPDIVLWGDYQVSWFSSQAKLKIFREQHVATDLDIDVTYPKRFECFPNNATRFIHWLCAVPGNHPSSVSIEFSESGSAGPWVMVETDAPNNGTYQWAVPGSVVSTDCYFRLIATDSTTMITDTSINQDRFQVGVCEEFIVTSDASSMPTHNIQIFPNPTNDYIDIYSCKGQLVLTDLTGQVVNEFLITHSPFRLILADLAAGVYMLRSETGVAKLVLLH